MEILKLPILLDAKIRHKVFDLSGSFPFEIFFLLARPWPTPKERNRHPGPLGSEYIDRPLTLRVRESTLDIDYALKYGHLKIFDQWKGGNAIDFSDIVLDQSSDAEYITLESGAGSDKPWNQRLRELSTRIDPHSAIGKKILPNRRYRLEIPEDDRFPVQDFTLQGARDNEEPVKGPSETFTLCKWVTRSALEGFTALPYLRQPPPTIVRLSATSNKIAISNGGDIRVKIEIISKNDQPVTVKSNGRQPYLAAQERDIFWPSERPRITCPDPGNAHSQIHWSNLSIRKTPNGEEMIREYTEICTVPALTSNKPRRIYRDEFTTLEPNVPILKEDSLARIYPESVEFEPGMYRLTLSPIGAVWFWGSTEDIFGENDSIDKYPWPPSETLPVLLASDDIIEFSIAG